jgi:Ca2+-binding RTX toxin-like protein
MSYATKTILVPFVKRLPSQRGSANESTITTTLVIFDSQVADLPLLYKALLPDSIAHTIQPHQNSIDHITHLLTETGATKLAIVAHGQPGAIQIGNGKIDRAMLEARSGLLQEWGLDSIALYSCEVGADVEFINRLGELTGAKIAASTSKVGAGKWELDSGLELLEIDRLANYNHTLTTFTGTAGNDYASTAAGFITGFTGGTVTDLNDANGDIFDGLDGDDFVRSGNADDTFYGGNGIDTLYGNGGLDLIFGQAGDDFLYGEAGNDTILGGLGIDTILGDIGTDLLYGDDGNDIINGGDDNDFLFGQAGNDTLNGDAGNDYIFGGIGTDTINGGVGVDEIYGEADNDKIYGGGDNDFLFGQLGDDFLYGDAGNDYLVGGDGRDVLYGGDGIDQLNGEAGNDVLYGDDGDDALYGNDGNDIINGGIGNDFLDGGLGDDNNLTGGIGNDVIFGGDGNDTLYGESIREAAGVDYLYGGNGNDILYGSAGSDFLIGGAGSDVFAYSAISDAGDIITDFDPSATGDKIDLKSIFNDIFGNPHSVSSVNATYLQFVQSGTDTLCQVDQDGAGTTYGFVTMATINNVNFSQFSIGTNVIV